MIRPRYLPLVLSLGLIAFWTLLPSTDGRPEPFSTCLVCGSRGTADAILNLLLFIPLGVAIGRSVTWKSALGAGFLVSAVVELCQTGIPGRQPTVGDLLFNSVGALVGFLLFRSHRRRPGRGRGEVIAVLAAGGVGALWILAGLIRSPVLPQTLYYGQWTPDLGRSRPYAGHILTANAGELEIPNEPIAESTRLRELLLSGVPLEVLAVNERRTQRHGLLFSIHDEREREIVSLAVEGDDLLASYGSRIEPLRLEPAVARFPGLLSGIEPADTFAVSFNLGEVSATALVDGQEREAVRRYSPGDGWRLLIAGDGSPSRLGALISLLWLAGLALPVGYLARSPATLLLGTGVLYAAVLGAYLSGMRSLDILEAFAPAAGAALGWLISRSLERTGRLKTRPHLSPDQAASIQHPARRLLMAEDPTRDSSL